MKTEYFMCICCWFYTLKNPFDSEGICKVCKWQDSANDKFYPYSTWWANIDNLVNSQEKLGFLNGMKEFDWYIRNPNWKLLTGIKIKDKPYVEKWFYKDVLEIYNSEYYEKIYKEAQKYNPTDYEI